MKEKSIQLFSFRELSDEAKAYAIEEYRKKASFPWEDEWLDSLRGAETYFNFHTVGTNSINVKSEDMSILEEAKDLPSYPFTGVYSDEAFLKNIRRDTYQGDTLEEILRECYNSFNEAYEKEVLFYFSDQTISEELEEVYGEEFLESGVLL